MLTTLPTVVDCGPPGGVGTKDETGPTVVLAGRGVEGPDEDWEEREAGLAGMEGLGARVTGDATCNNSLCDGN